MLFQYPLLSLSLSQYIYFSWVDLALPGQQRMLKSPHGVATFEVDSHGERFRYLRVKSLGPNQRGDNALHICAFEFYGFLYRA
jgi:hypothetical protein